MRVGNGWQILFSVLVLGSMAPSSFAYSKQLDERDRTVDLVLGGLEQGSRLPRSAPASVPVGASRKAPGAAVSHADTGAARVGRATTGTNRTLQSGGTVANPPISGGGQTSDNRGTGGDGTATPSPGGAGGTGITVKGETNLGGTGVNAGTGTQIETGTEPTIPGTETSSGGETTGGIHVEVDTTEGGELNAGTQVETGDTSLGAGTGVDTGTETGADLGGQVDVTETTDTGGTALVGSAEVTSPTPIDTTTSTELDSTLTGGADDASVESDVTEEALGDNADDCTVVGLISCPSIP